MTFLIDPFFWAQLGFIALALCATVWHIRRDGPVMLTLRQDDRGDRRPAVRNPH